MAVEFVSAWLNANRTLPSIVLNDLDEVSAGQYGFLDLSRTYGPSVGHKYTET